MFPLCGIDRIILLRKKTVDGVCNKPVNSLHAFSLRAFCRLLIFSKLTFSKNSFGNTNTVLTSLDPDQAQHFVRPDLGPDCLQRLSADNSITNRQK